MNFTRRFVIALLFTLALTAHAADTGERENAGTYRSLYTRWTYPLQVYLPPGYAETERRYPVLYALDSRVVFNMIADLLDELAIEAIVIGIDATTNARRGVDFDIPGAAVYTQFLTQELIPWVDEQYRTDPGARALAGHSLGGLLCGLMLLFDEPEQRHFNAYLISDGSFWDKPEKTQVHVDRLRRHTDTVPVSVFLAAATRGNRKSTDSFQALIERQGFQELNMVYKLYRTSHKGVIAPSYRDGLVWLYKSGASGPAG